MKTTPSRLRTRFNLDRALAATRRALRKLVTALAAQIVAPAPSEISDFKSARRTIAASRRVHPPFQPSNPSTLEPPDPPSPFTPWPPGVDWRIVPGPDGRETFQLRPGAYLTEKQYEYYRVHHCLRACWNSRNPCPN